MSDAAAHDQPASSAGHRPRSAASPHIQNIIDARLSRRTALLGMAGTAAAGMFGGRLFGAAQAAMVAPSLAFTELTRVYDETDHVAPGYAKQVLIRWGDALVTGAPALDPAGMTGAAQEQQFGYNNDFTALLPLPTGSASSDRGQICVNREYANPHMHIVWMWPGLAEEDAAAPATAAARSARRAAHASSWVDMFDVCSYTPRLDI